MAEVHEQGELGAGVDEVWKVVGDFGGFLASLGIPCEVSGDGVGATRTISMGPAPTVERLEELDEDAKRLAYSIVEGEFPFTGYLSTMQLSPAGDGRTLIEWSSTFTPNEGTSDDDAAALVSSIYRGGIKGLQARFGD